MIDHPPRSRNGDRCAPHCGNAADILPVFMQPCRVSVVVRYVVRGRMLAQISENRTADRKDQQAATGRGRDKRPCHVVIQDAVASCLSPGRPVGRGQVSAICSAIPTAVHAHCCLRAICHPERTVS
jgi:hypothetical protein